MTTKLLNFLLSWFKRCKAGVSNPWHTCYLWLARWFFMAHQVI